MSAGTPMKVGYECGECNFMADTRPGLKRHITVAHPAPGPDDNLAHALMRKLSQSSGCPVTSEGCIRPTPKKKTVPSNLQRVRYDLISLVRVFCNNYQLPQ